MTKPLPPGVDGGLEFELTNFDDALRAHRELPAGVTSARTLEPGYWERQRRPPGARDRALTGQAIDWLLRFPADACPRRLADQFPRVANQLAEVWSRPLERRHLLDDLLSDSRGHRAGFPAPVQEELQRLRAQA